MRNQDMWTPSKYVYQHGRLAASRNAKDVGLGSRLMADITAKFYDDALQRHARGRLLDLGCGYVPLYLAYRDRVTEAVCVDWCNTLHKNEFLDAECDLTQTLPFEDDAFDTVILSDVLEHIPEPAALWREMRRILAAEGKLIMNVPFYYWLHEQPHDYYRYTEFALRRFVDNSAMTLVELHSMGGAPEIMADIFAKNALRIPKVGGPLALLAQWLAGRFIDTRTGQKVSRSTASRFPLGYFLVAQKPASASSRRPALDG